MPRTLRFHLDEQVHGAVREALRRAGMDATDSREAGLLSAPDEEQLAHAAREGRVMVTHDADYLRLHRRGARHAGIAYFQSSNAAVGEVIRSLALMWEAMEPAEMAGRVEFF